MEPIAPASSQLETSRKFVNDNNLSVSHDIILIAVKKCFRAHSRFQMMNMLDTSIRVDVRNTERALRFFDPAICELNLFVFLVNYIILFALESADDSGKAFIETFGIGNRGRDNEGSTCFVDQDRIDFVYDRIMVSTLTEMLRF